MIELKGQNMNLSIDQGPALGPVLEVFVPSVQAEAPTYRERLHRLERRAFCSSLLCSRSVRTNLQSIGHVGTILLWADPFTRRKLILWQLAARV